MAYTHSQYEVMMTNEAVITSTGDKATWAPGYVPHNLRAWAFLTGVVATVTAAVLALDKQPIAGSAAGRIASFVSPLKLAINQALGSVVYKDGMQAKISPGEQLVFNITTAATAGTGSAIIFVEPTWETPGNNVNMALTA
jgi:hypothetical protein